MDGAALNAPCKKTGPEALLQGPETLRAPPRAGSFGLPRLSGLTLLLSLLWPGAVMGPAVTLPSALALSLWAAPLAAESGSGRSGEEDDEDEEDDGEDDRDDDKDDDGDDSGGGGGGGGGNDDDDNSGGGGGGNDDDDDSGGGSGGGGGGSGGGDDGDESGSHSGSGSGSGRQTGGGSGGAASQGASSGPPEALFAEDILRVTFKGGASESLRGGTYEKRGPDGALIERRRARAADRNRLEALRAEGGAGLDSVSVVSRSQRALQFTDRRGWRETLIGTRYTLTDPQGRVVTRRSARAKDYSRLSALLGL
jgi:hypothetical protein